MSGLCLNALLRIQRLSILSGIGHILLLSPSSKLSPIFHVVEINLRLSLFFCSLAHLPAPSGDDEKDDECNEEDAEYLVSLFSGEET